MIFLAGYAYLHTSSPRAESFILEATAQDRENDTGFDPDMLTDYGTASG